MSLTIFIVGLMITKCISLATQCQSGHVTDIRSDNNNIIDWEVCQVRDNQAWIQHGINYGKYDKLSICQSLGYESVSYKRYTGGYRCGNISGYSCNNPLDWNIFFSTRILDTNDKWDINRKTQTIDPDCCKIAWVCANNSYIPTMFPTISPTVSVNTYTTPNHSDIITMYPTMIPSNNPTNIPRIYFTETQSVTSHDYRSHYFIKWLTLVLIICIPIWICLTLILIYVYLTYKKSKQECPQEVVIQMKHSEPSKPSKTISNDIPEPTPELKMQETDEHYNISDIDMDGDQPVLPRYPTNSNPEGNDSNEGIQVVYMPEEVRLSTKTKTVI
mmetsp:Transcript_36624/g.45216  ORF Transcript_36624/g.45216 Transcript_36624/m.45216 type:complete len:330 (-) Transcript_36624:43-1032(-)